MSRFLGPYKKKSQAKFLDHHFPALRSFGSCFLDLFRPTLGIKVALFGESATDFLWKLSYKKWSRAIPFAVEARSQMGLALILDPIVRL